MTTRTLLPALTVFAFASSTWAREFHVATNGIDSNPGTPDEPLRTIQRGAELAQPGDTVTVHQGVYRERITPSRGGESDARCIVYQAAPGEKVVVKGSEPLKGWVKVQDDVWKATLPNAFFGKFNPYSDLIKGDWFEGKKRDHHSGAVYLNGEWLNEAAKLDEVLKPTGNGEYLVNVAWLQPQPGGERVPSTRFTAQNGGRKAPNTEGGDCLGYIHEGDWFRYEGVDFGAGAQQVELRVASAAAWGGLIEVYLDKPDGEILGVCAVPCTGGWQSWQSYFAKIKPLQGKQTICLRIAKNRQSGSRPDLQWFATVDADTTTIWARFTGVNPNEQLVEINARQTVFYPAKTGVNYLTVRGFTLEQAATPWAPPTAEQIGLIGTNWSKGWIIENNVIRYSRCSGVALGKHGDEWDNKSANTEGYVKTIERALKNGWSKENIGHHFVRNNHISHCEQTGVVGSMGCAFSTVTGNTIHDIHVLCLFTGAEMAGIKFHGAIDVEISHNNIYHTVRGIWLDWMAQGTRVTGNLLHDNQDQDLFTEVDHGPILVDNNLLLSPRQSILTCSQGSAYVHNLIVGNFQRPTSFDARMTPFHKAHSTAMAGLHNNPTGDDRFFNNVFVKSQGLDSYDAATLPVWMAGNVFLAGARAPKQETSPLINPDVDPALKLIEKADGFHLELTIDKAWATEPVRKLVTTELLGNASIPSVPFENADGSPIRIATDYFGKQRNESNPTAGPFEQPGEGRVNLKVW